MCMKTYFKLSALLFCLIALAASAQNNNYDDVYFSTKDYNNSVLKRNKLDSNIDLINNSALDNPNYSNDNNNGADNPEKTVSNSGIDYYNNLTFINKDSSYTTNSINITNNYNGNNSNYSAGNTNLYDYNSNYPYYNRFGRQRRRGFFYNWYYNNYPCFYNTSFFYNYNPYQFGCMGAYGNYFYNQNSFINCGSYSPFYSFGYNNCWNNYGSYSGFNYGYNPFFSSYYQNNSNTNFQQKNINPGYYGPRNSYTGSGGNLSSTVRNQVSNATKKTEVITNGDNTGKSQTKVSEKTFNNVSDPANLNRNYNEQYGTVKNEKNPTNSYTENIGKEISPNQNTKNIENNQKYLDNNRLYENKNSITFPNQEPNKNNKQQTNNSEKTYKSYLPEKNREYYEKRESYNNSGHTNFENLNDIKGDIYIESQPKRANSYERPPINPNTYVQPRGSVKDINSQNQIRSKNYDTPVLDRNTINQQRNQFNNELKNSRNAIENNSFSEPRQTPNPTYRSYSKPTGSEHTIPNRSISPGSPSPPNQFNGGRHNSSPTNTRNAR